MKRRTFLVNIAKAAFFSLFAKFVSAGDKIVIDDEKVQVVLSEKELQKLMEKEGAIRFEYGKKKLPLVIWNQDGKSLRAFSAKCTHRGCTVNLPQKGVMECPCHGAQYDQDGALLKGPAKEPLKEYSVSLDKNKLTVFFNQKITTDSLEINNKQ